MSTKKSLSAAIKTTLRLQGKKQWWLAEKVGVKFNTFRVHLRRNEFYEEEARRICETLALGSPDLLKDHYKYRDIVGAPEWKAPKEDTLSSLLHSMDRRSGKVSTYCDHIRDSFLHVMGKLAGKDISVVFTATVTPIEMEKTKDGVSLRMQIAAGIAAGATFLYIRPTEEKIKKYISDFDLRNIISFIQQVKEFDTFREKIVDHLMQLGHAKEEAESTVIERTAQIFSDDCPFCVPGVSFSLIRTFTASGQAISRVSVRLPGQMAFLCWDHDVTASRMVSVATAIVKRDGKELPSDSPEKKLRDHVLNQFRDYHLVVGHTYAV